MDLDELKQACAAAMRSIRLEEDLSLAKMAEAAAVDPRTWARVEKGETSLPLANTALLFATLGRSALRELQEIIYPDIYKDLGRDSSTAEIRAGGTTWINHIATDQQARLWDYIIFGRHGSNANAQLTEFAMLDQLPMRDRLIIGQNILMMWRLAKVRGELVGADDIVIDVQSFADGLAAGRDAVLAGRNSYTTIVSDSDTGGHREKD